MMNAIRSHTVKTLAVAIGLATGLAIGAGNTVHADDLTPYLGEDGIYHYDWYYQSFLELEEDLSDALAEDKVLMVKFAQQGCVYCEQVALEVLSQPAINAYVQENFVVVQMDIYGNRDVTDFDGDTLPENQMAQKWGVIFTPSIYFVTEDAAGTMTLPDAASANMPGAFGPLTFLAYLEWVVDGGYNRNEPFQKYFGRRSNELRARIDKANEGGSGEKLGRKSG